MPSIVGPLLRCASKLMLSGVIGSIFSTAPAAASTLWNWDYSTSGIRASGTFTTVETPDSSGGYLITGIAGTRNGDRITALQAPGTWIPGNEPYTVDDLVFRGSTPQLTTHGFGFATAGGHYSNPFYADFLPTPGYLEFFSTPPSGSSEVPVLFSATPVTTPEPATGGVALGALAWMLLRRQSKHDAREKTVHTS